MANLTVSGPGVDVTLRGYGPGAALSRALTEAERAQVDTASFYVRDEAGTAVGRVDRENGQTYVYSKGALDREAGDGGGGASLRSRRASSSTRRPKGQTNQNPTKEEPEVAETKKKTRSSAGGRKRSSTARSRRSSVAAAQEVQAVEVAGDDLYKGLIAEVRKVIHGVEAKPNASGTYTRLLKAGKAFAYVFPPRKGGVALKIPKQLLAVERELPDGHGFKKTGWGLTRTIKDPAETTVVAKALAVAAKAVKE